MTKADLADTLNTLVGLNKRESKDMVEAFFEEVSDALVQGEAVKLSGFGNFVLRDKPQRPGRNPKTGVEIPISARRVVTFHASPKLKASIECPGTVRNAVEEGRPDTGERADAGVPREPSLHNPREAQ